MKLSINSNRYTSTNNKVWVSPDLKTVSAESYDWWQYITTDTAGNVYFNNYSYSSSTNGHQGDAQDILDRLGIKVDVMLRYTEESLKHGPSRAIRDEIKCLEHEIKTLSDLIKKPRTHKKKNAERAKDIQRNQYWIKDLERVLAEYLDKKPIPKQISTCLWYGDDNEGFKNLDDLLYETDRDGKKTVARYRVADVNQLKPHFKKPNGKIKWIDLIAHVNRYGLPWSNAVTVEHLKAIKALLGLKHADDHGYILGYHFSKDIIPMVPERDSKEYRQLETWLKRHETHPRNVYLLDKLHTYLINKMNRRKSPDIGIPGPIRDTGTNGHRRIGKETRQ